MKKFANKIFTVIFFCLIISCNRKIEEVTVNPVVTMQSGARAAAILESGENPLWFELKDNGAVLLERIEDAFFSAALIPWPYANFVSFFHEKDGELFLAINRSGFLKFSPYEENSIAMYRFYHGYWQKYTAGGFVFYDDKPVVILYQDDRFLEPEFPPPLSRAWTFDMESNTPFPLQIPALEIFPADEGWNADTLRDGPGGFIYYRVIKNISKPEIKMLRTADLNLAGDEIPLDIFYSSAPIKEEIFHPVLPPLPQGYFYTGFGQAGDSLIGFWEEQEEFFIGAAGFVVVKNQ